MRERDVARIKIFFFFFVDEGPTPSRLDYLILVIVIFYILPTKPFFIRVSQGHMHTYEPP